VQIAPSPMTIADYCAAMDSNLIQINHEYQRSDKVWPQAARSFLVESILLGYPIPKIFLFQKTDLKSKKSFKEIVDGQQRSKAIIDFFHNRMKLSKDADVDGGSGRSYEELSEQLQGAFLNYQLSIDLFIGVTQKDIREAFRRLNSYTVPLNPEELRHAQYQGEFKWFVYKVCKIFEEAFIRLGVFGPKQIVRMQDTKLVTEFVFALIHGIKTSKSKDLDNLYKAHDKDFPLADSVQHRIGSAIELLLECEDLHESALMKPHVFYTLLLAISHALDPVEALSDGQPQTNPTLPDMQTIVANLSFLSQALEEGAGHQGPLSAFVSASSGKTNVESQRLIRFQWISRALHDELL
jgi:hypothetical protein